MQQDSVIGSPNQPRTLHRYAYAFNNPVNFTDPAGRMPAANGASEPRSYNNYAANAPGVAGLSAPGVTPPRSVNTLGREGHPTFSDPRARHQSQGHRPKPCGLGEITAGLWQASQRGTILYDTARFIQQMPPEVGMRLLLGAAITSGAIVATGGAAIPFIIAGAGIGASMGYGMQVWGNYQSGLRGSEAFTEINWGYVAQGGFYGGVSGAVSGVLTPLLPGGGGLATIAAAEFVEGRATQVVANVVSGRRWDKSLWNWQDIALDVIPGVSAGPLLRGAKRAFTGSVDLAGRAVRGGVGAFKKAKNKALQSVADLKVGRGFGGSSQVRKRLQQLDNFTSVHLVNPDTIRHTSIDIQKRWLLKNIERGNADAILQRFNIDPKKEWVKTTGLKDDVRGLGKKFKSTEVPPSGALKDTIQEFLSDEIPLIAVRSIPGGSEKYHGRLLHKPEGASAILKGPNGIRIIIDKYGRLGDKGQLQLVVSDLDTAVVFKANGLIMSDKEFRTTFIEPEDGSPSFNDILEEKLNRPGAVMVDHGHQVWGQAFVPGVPLYASLEDVYVIRKGEQKFNRAGLPQLIYERALSTDQTAQEFFRKVFPSFDEVSNKQQVIEKLIKHLRKIE